MILLVSQLTTLGFVLLGAIIGTILGIILNEKLRKY